MKTLTLLTALFTLSLTSVAQLSSITTVQNILCHGDTNGSITFEGVEGCFAPINVTVDSLPPMTFSTLKNDEYEYINHGTGTGPDVALGVTSGSTSIGDVYIAAGWFSDSISFDSITLYANGAVTAAFVACFDATTSAVLWADAATAGAGTYDYGYGAAMIGDKAYFVGYLEGTTEFGSATVTSGGGYQGFIAKYDIPTGLIDTVLQVGNAGTDEVSNIRAGADDRLYVTGDFTGSIDLAGNTYTASGSSYDLFVTCFDSSLTTNYWAATGGGSGTDVATDVVPSTSGSAAEYAYISGYFSSTVTLGSNSITSNGGQDFLIAKVDSNGNWIWAEEGGGSSTDNAFSIDLNSAGDRLYVAGQWKNTLNYGSSTYASNGAEDGFIAYLDTAGALDDLYQFGGSGLDGVFDLVSIDDDYIVFAAGHTGSWTYADSNFVTNGGVDAFAGKIGPNQHEIWGKNFGSSGSNGDAFNSISAGPGERLHCAGFIGGNASSYQAGLSAVGPSDAVITNDDIMGNSDTIIVLSGLSAGEHYIVMTDSSGNSTIDTIEIIEPDPISIAGTVTNASSGTATDGAIDITVTGGTPGYSYMWSNTMTTEDITNLSIGTYTVTVTDTNGCQDSASFVVDTGSVVFAVTYQITHLACGGDSNGMIDLTVSGGTPPYDYDWSNSATTEDLTGLNGGTYTVTVTDNDTNTFIETFIVNEPTPISVSSSITPPANGTSNDGAIDITVSGGQAPYAFAWSNTATTEDISSLGIGNYTVTVTDSSGCTLIQSFYVDTIPSLSLALVSSDVTCINSNNGAIDLTVIGGVSPYTFLWSNSATTEDISGLAPGTYTVTVTDNASQSTVEAGVVGSNPIHPDPVVGPVTGPSSAQSWVTFPYSVPATNGSSFTWTVSGGLLSSSTSNSAFIQWNAGPAGVVYVSESDANGCWAMDSLEVEILFVGIDEKHENSVVVYPNPAADFVQINVPTILENSTATLHDMQGKLAFTQRIAGQYNQLDISLLPAGVYILRIANDDVTVNHRISVQ